MNMTRKPYRSQRAPRGSAWKDKHPEAARLWFARDEEPADTQPWGLRSLMVLEDDADKADVLMRQVLAIAVGSLGRTHAKDVLRMRLEGFTMQEVADALGVARARVNQIEQENVRLLRRCLHGAAAAIAMEHALAAQVEDRRQRDLKFMQQIFGESA